MALVRERGLRRAELGLGVEVSLRTAEAIRQATRCGGAARGVATIALQLVVSDRL